MAATGKPQSQPSTQFQGTYHAPLANGVDLSVPPMFGGPGPIQTQGVKTPPLGVGGTGGRIAKPRN